MTMAERDEYRTIQDYLISLAERFGYSSDIRISADMPEQFTLTNLRYYLATGYMSELRNVIYNLEMRLPASERKYFKGAR